MLDFASLIFVISIHTSIIATQATNIICPIQTLYQFGDSLSDTGNLVRIPPVGPTLPVARPPYGQTFPGRPTGRWSDGRLIVDYTATALGLPLLNPILDTNASFSNGANFAVAGAPALNNSFFAPRGIIVSPIVGSLFTQLTSFFNYLSSICSTPTECSDSLRRALIFVEIGGNDINYALSQGKSFDEIRTYVPPINQAISNGIREMIRAGAKRFVVAGNFPVGCFPFVVAIFASNDSTTYDELGCIRRANELAVFQNDNLKAALASLRGEYPGVSIVYADFYNAFRSIFRLAPLYGFDRTTILRPCCMSRVFDFRSPEFCGNPGVPVCSNPQRSIHWDGLHLTDQTYRYISKIIMPSILSTITCF